MSEKSCEHIIGEWQSCDEGGLIEQTDHDINLFAEVASEWFNYCPRCGAELPDLGLPTFK